MARTKQRETYGNGSVFPVMVAKTDKNGQPVMGRDGNPAKVQEKDKRGLPVWRVCITLGVEEYADKNGKLRKRQRKVQKRVHGTLENARSVAKQLTTDFETLDADKTKASFSALCREWLSSPYGCPPNCSNAQRRQYETRLGYMAAFLDRKQLTAIEKSDVKSALDSIRYRKGKKPLSVTTMNKILDVTNRVFEFAIDEDYIMRNPCRRIHKFIQESSDAEPQRNALSEKDAYRLRVALDEQEKTAYADFAAKEQRQIEWGKSDNRSSIYGLCNLSSILATRLLLATGARRGEILGLTWGNVDLSNGTIRIAQSLSAENEIKAPKTDAGIRSLYIDQRTAQHLQNWKAFQARALGMLAHDKSSYSQTDETPVFTSDVGGWIEPTNYSRWWRKFRDVIGFETLLTHELRHTQVTLLSAYNVPDDMLKNRIGHARQRTATANYLHELPARDALAASIISRVLYGQKEKHGEVIEFERKTA